jgi:hypothetical protein
VSSVFRKTVLDMLGVAIGELRLQKTNKPKIEEKHYVTQVS